MNQQKQPDDPAPGGAGFADNPSGQNRGGAAQGQEQQDAAARPTNDRQNNDTAADRIESDKS